LKDQMGMRWWRTGACERAQQWISLELDGELSQLEQAALARHLDGCASCREVSAEIGGFTRLIRAAPLLALEHPLIVELPRRARVRAARRAVVSLAFAGLMGAAVLAGFLVPTSRTTPPSALSFRSAKEQQRFAHIEAQRLEPAVFVSAKPPVQSFAPRVLV
jgi:ferric-dicitrate binding protein FerR (iron transport regulator)